MIFTVAVDPVMRDAVRACKRLLDIRESEAAARAAKDAALLAVYQSGVPRGQVGKRVRDALITAGWTAEAIGRVGVADGTVEVALKAALR